MIEYNMTPEEEAKANDFGDKLAREVLGLKVENTYSPDSLGRTRWRMAEGIGNKTGLGLLRTLERFFEETISIIDGEPPDSGGLTIDHVKTTLVNGLPIVVPPGSKIVKNLVTGQESVIPQKSFFSGQKIQPPGQHVSKA